MSNGIPARPTVYYPRKGGEPIHMRSRLEARTAAALDNLEAEWQYEPQAYATSSGQFLPDFVVKNVRKLLDIRAPEITGLIVEACGARERFEERHQRERTIIAMATGLPLMYVGMGTRSSLGPWLYGYCFLPDDDERHLAALGRYRDDLGLYLNGLAYAWLDGYRQGANDVRFG